MGDSNTYTLSRQLCWPASTHSKDPRTESRPSGLLVGWLLSWHWWVCYWYSDSKEAEHWLATPGEIEGKKKNQISSKTKRHPLKSSYIHGDWQTDKTTPSGSPERKRRASSPHVVTAQISQNQGLQRSQGQTPHTGSVWDISGHVTPGQVHSDWVLGKPAWLLALSVLILSQSEDLPSSRWPFWGLRPPPRLAEHLLLSNMPTRSPQGHNRPLIHATSSPLPVHLPLPGGTKHMPAVS